MEKYDVRSGARSMCVCLCLFGENDIMEETYMRHKQPVDLPLCEPEYVKEQKKRGDKKNRSDRLWIPRKRFYFAPMTNHSRVMKCFNVRIMMQQQP